MWSLNSRPEICEGVHLFWGEAKPSATLEVHQFDLGPERLKDRCVQTNG